MDVVIMVAQLILSLSILVVLHEGGHFLPAKLFGTRVEKFYLFFNPYFELFKFQYGETEYGIGWLPLGGYVKIAGMIDESFDKEQLEKDPEPWEFRSKPAWQRLIIMLGGVTVNFILGFLIFGFMLFKWGSDYLPPENAKYGVYADSMAQTFGIEQGDIIVGLDHVKLKRFKDYRGDLIMNDAKTIQVIRDGKEVDIPVAEGRVRELAGYRSDFILPRFPFIVDAVVEGDPGDKAGFKKGDQLLSFNGKPALYFTDFLLNAKENKDKTVEVEVLRGTDTLLLTPHLTKKGTVGLRNTDPAELLTYVHVDYTLAEAMPAGVAMGMKTLGDNMKGFGKIFTGKIAAKDSLGSFITIGKLFSPTWDWHRFWQITGLLSLILAFMNILPIPLLDGGHVMFLLYEMVAGRPPNEKFQEIAQLIGLVLLVGLMIFALGLDVFRALGWI